MAPTAKANYKTYDAQARLLRAIVAAHPEVKWNYKDIAECYGSDMTPDALNHRFRHLRAEALIISKARQQGGFDMKDMKNDGLPKTQGAVDKSNIALYFGASTGDGIGFQFRTIKKDADAMRDAIASGSDPKDVPIDGTTGKSITTGVRSTPSKKAPASSSSTPASRKRKAATVKNAAIKTEILSDDNEEESQDWSEMDAATETPSKKAKAAAGVQKTSGRGAKAKAAQRTVEDTSTSEGDGDGIGVRPASIFGNPTPSAFNAGAVDSLINGGGFNFGSMNNYAFEAEGEI